MKGIEEFGVWEVGLLTSFKKEVEQRGGVLRICNLDASLGGYFHNDRFARRVSSTPAEDIDRAIQNAERLLEGKSESKLEIFYQKEQEDLPSL